MKYFGIGLQKTGTTTLSEYFREAGFEHLWGEGVVLTHLVLRNDFSQVQDRIATYDSFEDAPWFLIYRYLYENVPNSKFILTVRSSSEKWLKSACNHVDNYGPQFLFKQVYGFPSPYGHEEEFLSIYEEHNKNVEDFFADKEERFLKVCFEEPEDASKLLAFIGKPDLQIPNDIRTNSGSGDIASKTLSKRTRGYFVYWTRVFLDKFNLPMR